jgi:hypothetical protein
VIATLALPTLCLAIRRVGGYRAASGSVGQGIVMRKFLESGAAQIGVRIQSIGVNFDPDVLSLPGGTAIAVILWLCTGTMVALKRCAPRFRAVDKEPACLGCPGRPLKP